MHSGDMKLFVPVGNLSTADSIHFLVRPHLARMGVQSWGLTQTFAPDVYAFKIQVEGKTWDDISQKLNLAQTSLLTTYGLQVMSS